MRDTTQAHNAQLVKSSTHFLACRSQQSSRCHRGPHEHVVASPANKIYNPNIRQTNGMESRTSTLNTRHQGSQTWAWGGCIYNQRSLHSLPKPASGLKFVRNWDACWNVAPQHSTHIALQSQTAHPTTASHTSDRTTWKTMGSQWRTILGGSG